MKKTIVILVLFYLSAVNAQDLKKIKNSEIIYFSFKNLKQQEKVFQKTTSNENSGEYYYNYLTPDKKNYVIFTFNYYLKTNTLVESKSFLRKNKKIVIDYNFLRKHTIQELNEMFKNKKHIYLIDSKETEKCKYKLKEVIYQSSTLLEM